MHYNPNYTTKIPTYRWLPYRNFGPAPAPAYLDAVVEHLDDHGHLRHFAAAKDVVKMMD